MEDIVEEVDTEKHAVIIELEEYGYDENRWCLSVELYKGEDFIDRYTDLLLFKDGKFVLDELPDYADEECASRTGVETLLSLSGETVEELLSRFTRMNHDGKLKKAKIENQLKIVNLRSTIELKSKN